MDDCISTRTDREDLDFDPPSNGIENLFLVVNQFRMGFADMRPPFVCKFND